MDYSAAIDKANEILDQYEDRTFVFNFNSRQSLYDFGEYLIDRIHKCIDVSDYCFHDDEFPIISKLISDCNNLDQPSLLRGLDWALALMKNEDKKSVYQKLIRPYKSIGAPLFILSWNSSSVLSQICLDIRFKNFIFNVTDDVIDLSFDLVLISDELDCPMSCSDSFKTLLKTFEKNKPESRYYLKTSIPSGLFSEDVIKITTINSYKSLVKLNEPEVTFIEQDCNDPCWIAYYIDYPSMNLNQVFNKCFKNCSISSCLDICKSDKFKLWVFLSYYKTNPVASIGSYLNSIIQKINVVDQFNDLMIYSIVDVDIRDKNFLNLYNERKQLVQHIQYFSHQEYVEHIVGIKDVPDCIAYLTDLSEFEKEKILDVIVEYGKVDNKILSLIKNAYVDLWYYLSDYSCHSLHDVDYFIKYRELKVLNRPPDEKFMELVNESYSRYSKYNSRLSVFNSIISKKTIDYIFFFDALGIEYIPYIKHICDEKGLFVDCRVCKVNLPSITGINKQIIDEYRDKIPVYDSKKLDKIYHNRENLPEEYTKTSKYIVKVLDVIREAIDQIAEFVKVNQTCLLYSDHGASRAYVLNGQNDLIDWGDIDPHHNGRCARKGNSNHKSDVRVYCEDEYYVVKGYSKFKGAPKARVESHGGCTLEEAIVPLMLISVSDKSKRRKITVKNKNNVIVTNPALDSAILELVYPIKSENVHIRVAGYDYEPVEVNHNTYKFNVLDVPSSTEPREIILFDGDDFIDSFEVIIERAGVKQKKMFGLF